MICLSYLRYFFFFSSRRRHTRYWHDWSSDVCSSDLARRATLRARARTRRRVASAPRRAKRGTRARVPPARRRAPRRRSSPCARPLLRAGLSRRRLVGLPRLWQAPPTRRRRARARPRVSVVRKGSCRPRRSSRPRRTLVERLLRVSEDADGCESAAHEPDGADDQVERVAEEGGAVALNPVADELEDPAHDEERQRPAPVPEEERQADDDQRDAD